MTGNLESSERIYRHVPLSAEGTALPALTDWAWLAPSGTRHVHARVTGARGPLTAWLPTAIRTMLVADGDLPQQAECLPTCEAALGLLAGLPGGSASARSSHRTLRPDPVTQVQKPDMATSLQSSSCTGLGVSFPCYSFKGPLKRSHPYKLLRKTVSSDLTDKTTRKYQLVSSLFQRFLCYEWS